MRAFEGPYSGRVIGYSSFLELRDVTFKVSKSGHARVQASGVKNVHAGVIGTVVSSQLDSRLPNDITWNGLSKTNGTVIVTYNPWIAASFIEKETRRPIASADGLIISGSLLEAINPLWVEHRE